MKWILAALFLAAVARTPLERALDSQDKPELQKLVREATANAAKRPRDAAAQYQVALANSVLAQLAIESGDKNFSGTTAEIGIAAAREAVRLAPGNAEYHRMLGTLCGQVIPANVITGMRFGRCALEEVDKAIELNPRSSNAWLSRGVGNYYLPPMFGGGVEKAIEDLEKAVALDPNSPEAHLWLGIALRKAGRNPDARKAIAKSLSLNPERKWAKEQLEKTPVR